MAAFYLKCNGLLRWSSLYQRIRLYIEHNHHDGFEPMKGTKSMKATIYREATKGTMASVNESMITDESVLAEKGQGDEVIGSSINGEGIL